jgi:flagellar protein FlaF
VFRNAKKAYDVGARTTTSTRDLEAAALFKAARMLEAVQKDWDAPDRLQRLHEALRHNQRLWTLFQVELQRDDQALAAGLRENLLRLSAFVDRRTFELIAHAEREQLSALIEIDRQIGAGLGASPDGAGTQEAA